ncbi:MAG: Ig-like domain repeat protein [Fimbriimonas ginsengisoli]|uniref:Ig-like domain repeat protein n=1 Tax=Fimbriimonas ginsengisoli TaxID=1005039 RepID=A0A931LSE6_FIMGI|nr:Ig-like domain repeat protein [Fimbriimonas ginsengisoli]
MKRSYIAMLAVTTMVAALIGVSTPAWASGRRDGPTVATDKTDYAPGDVAQITGAGWYPNQPVTLQVVHIDGTAEGGAGHEPWIVTADEAGNLAATWLVSPDDSIGSSFKLTANSQPEGMALLYAECFFTDKTGSTTTVTSSVNPSTYGQSVTFTATVNGSGSAVPSGTIAFSEGATTLGTGVLSGSGHIATATFTINSLIGGVHTITADFNGDTNYTKSSGTVSQTVNPASSTTDVVSSLNPANQSQTVTFTATVTGGGPTGPTGTVTFKDGAATLGTGTLSGGSASLSTSALSVGHHNITATYSGDGNYNASTSNSLNENIQSLTNTNTSLASSPNPSVFGGTVAFTASVTPTSGPTGTVTFTEGATTLGTATLSGGSATLNLSTLSIGTHVVTAAYGGDSNFNGSTSSSVSQLVKGVTTTAVVSSLNPSVFTQSVTFTVTVSTTSGTPTGTVTLLDGATTIATLTLNASAQATFTSSGLAVGTHPISAVYAGDTNYNGSTSPTLNQVVNQIATTTSVVSSLNPSFSGDSVTFTATVAISGPGSGTPTGSVTFSDGVTPLATVSLSGATAAYTTSALAIGSHTINAAYSDGTNFASSSGSVSQTVNDNGTTTTLSSTSNPSTYGQSVTFDARAVTNGTGNVGGGSITFSDGATVLATIGVTGSGRASYSTSTLTAGSHTITAAYSGSPPLLASSASMSQVVNQAAATVTLSNLTQTYDGSPKSATVTTNPAGLSTSVTYNGSSTPPTSAGSYAVAATITDPNYAGSASGTLVVNKAAATLSLSNLTQTYDGSPKSATVTTSPLGLSGVSVTYNGSGTAPTNAGSYAVVASLSNTNYQAPNASGTLTINKAAATLTISDTSKTYNGSSQGVTVTTSPLGLIGVSVTYDGSATAPTNAGSYAVVASLTSANYQASNANATLTIAKATPTVTVTGGTFTYDGAAHPATGSVTGVLGESLGALTFSYAPGGASAPVTPGSYTATGSFAGDANYIPGSSSATITINKADQTITFGALAGKTYGDAPFSVSATASSGLAVGFSIFSGPATIAGSNITITGAGLVIVRASQPGDSNHNAAPNVDRSFTVAKATPIVTATGGSYVYDGFAHPATGTITGVNSEDLGTPTFTYTPGGATAPVNAGTYSAIGSFAGNANYNSADSAPAAIVISKAPATLTLGSLAATYDGSPKSVPVTTSPPSLTGVSVTYNGSATAPTNAGSYAVIASLDNPNYSASNATGTLVVAKADQTITFGALADRHFGDASFDLSATSSSGLTVSFAVTDPATLSGVTVSVPSDGGITKIITVTASQPGDSNHNPAPDVVQTFKLLENVAPVSVAASAPPVNGAGWNRNDVTITITATDNVGGDGVKEIRYQVGGGPIVVVSSDNTSVVISTEGTTAVSYWSVDNAGNAEVAKTITILLDKTAPDLSATPDRAPDSNGWYTSPVTFTFAGSDFGSGIDGTTLTTPILYSGPDSKNAFVSADVSDVAGNATHRQFPFKYDATAPTIVVTGLSGHCHQSVTFGISASDSGSGATITLVASLKKNGLPVWSQTVSDVLPVIPDQTLGGSSDDGMYELNVTATDEAGNVSTRTINFEINNQAPTITFLAGSPQDQQYYNSDQTIQYSVTTPAPPLTIVQTLTSLLVGVDVGPMDISSPTTVSAEGKYLIHIDAIDCTGLESTSDLTFYIDRTAPLVDDAALAGDLAPNPGWFKSSVTAAITASDPNIRSMPDSPSDIAGSGVKEIRYYATGAQPIGDSFKPIVVPGNNASVLINVEGITTITYWAVDNAGNAATPKTVVVRYDNTPPDLAQPADITVVATGFDGATVTFASPVATDNVDSAPTVTCTPLSGSLFGVGATLVTCTAVDAAGNQTTKTFTVNVVNPVPVLNTITPAMKAFGDGAFTMTLDGDKFMPNSVVRMDGEDRPTHFVSFNRLQADIPASDMSAAGTKQVTVFTPTPGGGTSAGQTFTIDKAHQTITFGALAGKTFGDPPFTVSATASSGLPVSFSIASGPTSVAGSIVTITGAGTATVRASQAGDSNWYAADDVDQALVIAKADPTVTATGGTFTYDGSPHPATGTTTGVGGAALDPPTFTYAPGGTAPIDAGTYLATGSFAGNANYNPASATATIVINKADQTITFDALADKTYGDAPIALIATASSGLDVSFCVVSGPATISGNTLTITGAGTVVVRAKQPGNHNYNAAPDVDRSFTVAKATATVHVTGGVFTYDGAAHPATGSIDGVNGENLGTPVFDYSPGGASAPVNAGTYGVSASFAGNANYNPASASASILINKAHATISLSGLSQVFDGTARIVIATTGPGGLSGVSVTYDGSSSAPINAGSYAIVASLTHQNYEADNATGTLVVAKADPIVTASGGTFTYDGLPHPATGSVTGVGGANLGTPDFAYAPGGASAPTNAGTYGVVASYAGSPNYNPASASATILINKADQTITFDALANKTYGDAPFSLSATASSGLSVSFCVVSGPATISANMLTITGAGAVVVRAKQPGDGNYNPAPVVDRGFTVAKFTPTVSVTGGIFVYDGNPHPATGSVTGANGEDLGAPSFSYSPGGTAPVNAGDYTATGSYPGNANYNPASSSASIHIDKAPATISLSDLSQTYNGSARVATATTTPAGLSGVSITYDGGGSAPVNAGSYAVVASLNNSNYAAPDATGALVVAKADPTVVATGGTYTYDASAHPATGTVTGVLSESLGAPTFAYTPGGASPPVNAGSYSVIGSFAGNGNYNAATSSPASILINKADQTISFGALPGRTYGDAPFALSASASSGLAVSFSVVSGPATLAGNTLTITAAGAVTVRAAQGGNGNYNAAPSVDQAFAVAKANPTVTINGGTFTYDNHPHPASGSVTGAHGEDLGAPAYNYTPGGSNAPVDVGTYPVSASFAGNGNYNPATSGATIVINKATLVVTADNKSKILGAPLPTLTGVLTGVQAGDAITATYSTTATQTSDVGTYPITPSLVDPGGSLGNYNVTINNGTLSILYLSNSGILPPINPDGTSVFKQGSTVPAKFKVYDVNGVSIGTPGVVTSFRLTEIVSGTVVQVVNEVVDSTTPDTAFRWDPTAMQWIFNISTKPLTKNQTYVYRISLKDGTFIDFRFGLK